MAPPTKTSVVLACGADQHYVRPLAVMLESLRSNLTRERALEVHVIDGGVSDTDKHRLEQSLGADDVNLHWHAPDRSPLVGVPLWGRMSVSAYDKLFVPSLLPDLDQALWLDCDTLVLADAAPLWDSGCGGHPLMAVQDPLVPFVSSHFGVARHRELGLRPDAKYFNAGVMSMNLRLWREQEVTARALAYLKTYAGVVSFWDQEGLNAALSDDWGELDPEWNWSVSFASRPGHGLDGHATRLRTPSAKIVHFSGNLKPWAYRGRHPYYEAYYDHVDRTAWPGRRPKPSWRTAVLSAYEYTPVRRLMYPAERLGTDVVMALTRRRVSAADLERPR